MIYKETQRLTIRDWEKDDIVPYSKIISNPLVMKYINHGETQSFDDSKRLIHTYQEFIDTNGWGRYALSIDDNKLIGFCGFNFRGDEIDFGWRLGYEFWNNGYGFEAAESVLDLCKSKLDVNKVTAIVNPKNIASIRIIEKIGMQLDQNTVYKGIKVKKYVF